MSTSLHAACTVGVANASFGSISSFTVNTTEQQTSANLTITCDTILNLLTNNVISMTVLSATATNGTHAELKRTDNVTITDGVPIRVCGNITCSNTTETPLGQTYTWDSSTLLGLLSSQHYVLPIYFRTVSGQSVSAGPYQVTITFSVYYSICATGALGICLSNQTGTTSVTSQLTMTVTNDCITISTPDVNFGSAPLVMNFPVVSQTVQITCTKDSLYTVGINNGNNSGGGSVRSMNNGSALLSYDIYQGATNNRWGPTGSDRWGSVDSTSVSSDGTIRSYNYTAQILTTQATPSSGAYTDTLVLDIAF
jgi:spore coat protein U-like protein